MRSTWMLAILVLAAGCESKDDDVEVSGTWNVVPPIITTWKSDGPPSAAGDPVLVQIGPETPPAPVVTPDPVVLLEGRALPPSPLATVVRVDWLNETSGASGVAALETLDAAGATWSALLPLVPGVNRIRVTASDSFRNGGEAVIQATSLR